MAGTAILSYLAGIIDGEGWISIKKNKPRTKTCSPQHFLAIGVSNTSEKLMLWLEENFGGRVLLIDRNRRQQEKVKKWKTCYQWDIGSKSAVELLQRVSPLLIIKSDKAKLALRFSETIDAKYRQGGLPNEILLERENMYQKMKQLNKRGA